MAERSAYSGLDSEVPEKAATMAGLMTIPMKARAISRSCIGEVLLCESSYELLYNLIIGSIRKTLNPTKTESVIVWVLPPYPP
jgi:hypothetical protein